MQTQSDKSRSLTLKRNGMTVQCAFGPDGRLEKKIERLNGSSRELAYEFDKKGHLTEVRRGNTLVEIYRYNAKGQRVMQRCHYGGLDESIVREYEYDDAGRLVQAGEISFAYDRNGALRQRRDRGGTTFFRYDGDTRLDTVTLPDGGEIRYEYDQANPLNPCRRFKNCRLTHEYAWRDLLRLSAYKDHDAGVEYQFIYDQEGRLDRLRLFNVGIAEERAAPAFADRFLDDRERARRDALRGFFAKSSAPLELLCCTDQVGTLRALIKAGTLSANSWTIADNIAEAYAKCDPHRLAHHIPTGAPNRNGELTGWAVKEIQRDSFGDPYYDSFPDFFLPIGFAGGLEDPDTGLVRFGWRDYDPTVGRFTAPDPARDLRGDGDLYDYCVDDPVSCVDPAGLFWFLPALYSGAVALAEAYPLLAGAAGAAGALGLGLGGSYLAAAGADLADNTLSHQEIRNIRPQKKSTAAWDGVNKVAPYAAATHAAAFSPLAGFAVPEATAAANAALGAMGPKIMAPVAAATGAATAAGQRIGASPYGDKILTGITHAAQFAEPFVIPGMPMVPSAPGVIGAVANRAWELYQEKVKK